MIDWTFDTKEGRRIATMQTGNEIPDYEKAGRAAQRLANEHQTTIKFTAWLEDREGATAYRYPTVRI